MNRALEDLIKEEVAALGYDVVELRQGGTGRRPLFDVRIDRVDGVKISIADCAQVSKTLEPRIDRAGLAAPDYVLEVSSPGVERPLRHAADWRRFVGRRASVLSAAVGGRMEVEVVGADVVDGIEVAVMRDERGGEHRVPLTEVKEARLVFHWNK